MHRAKITLAEAVEIYDKYATGTYVMRELADEYDLSRTRIEQIIRERPFGLHALRPPMPRKPSPTLCNGRSAPDMKDATLDRLVAVALMVGERRTQRYIAAALGLSPAYIHSLIRRYTTELDLIMDRLDVIRAQDARAD